MSFDPNSTTDSNFLNFEGLSRCRISNVGPHTYEDINVLPIMYITSSNFLKFNIRNPTFKNVNQPLPLLKVITYLFSKEQKDP